MTEAVLYRIIEQALKLSEHPSRAGTGILSLETFAKNVILVYSSYLEQTKG
jgi:hypothetical protein